MLALVFLSILHHIVAISSPYGDLPSSIELNAAVLHAPPFATVTHDDDGTPQFQGFQYDLLQRLKMFASRDNIDLNFRLSEAPTHYEDALDLIASNSNSNNNCTDTDDCLDLIVGNFYATPARSMRVDLSPAWLKSTISTIKYKDKKGPDFTTLTQASLDNGTVCLKTGTFYAGVVREKFPLIDFYVCESYDDCIQALKEERCALYADDELQLHYRAAWDPSLEVTREKFNTQWIVWPYRFNLDPTVRILMDRWMYAASINATLDDLYFQYFQKELCPVGTAGEHCELPCDPDHGQADAAGRCVCESIKWIGDDCSIEVPENIHSIPKFLKGAAYAMLAINILVIVVCAGWLQKNRLSAQVRYAQPSFLWLVLLGCLISSFTIIPMAQEDGGDPDNLAPASCMAIPWLYSVGFSVTFGTLFAKILRVYLIFTQSEHHKTGDGITTNNRRYFVSVQETLSVIGVVLLVDVLILVAWTVIDPLQWEREVIRSDQFGTPLDSQGYCTCEHWAAFAGAIAGLHVLLLGVACVMCYLARDIPTKFSEGKYLSFALVSNLQIFIVGVPILIILGADPRTSFFVRSAIVWANDLAVVSLVFGNLMYSAYTTPPEFNRASFVRREISSAISQFSKRKIYSSTMSLSGQNQPPSPPSNPAVVEQAVMMETLELGNSHSQSHTNGPDQEPVITSASSRTRRNASDVSSLTHGSHTTGSTSRKSVSWGMAYFSECGADEETGIPIVDPLPVDEASPPDKANRNQRFTAPDCQGAPQCVRSTASPEPSEEFYPCPRAPVLPERKSSIQMESMTEHMDNSGGSHGFIPQPRIDEEGSDSSGSFKDKQTRQSTEKTSSKLDVSDADMQSIHGISLFGSTQDRFNNRHEAAEQAPQKPDRILNDESMYSVAPGTRGSVERERLEVEGGSTSTAHLGPASTVFAPEPKSSSLKTAPQKSDRRLTDTSIASATFSDFSLGGSPPQKPIRRLTDASMNSAGLGDFPMTAPQPGSWRPDASFAVEELGVGRSSERAAQEADRRLTKTILSNDALAPKKPERMPTEESFSSFEDSLPQLTKFAHEFLPRPSTEDEDDPPVLPATSRHTVESAQGAPQMPGRRRSSSLAVLNENSSCDGET